MLWKINENDSGSKFVRLNITTMQEQGLLESQMEQWLADNPTAVLPEDESQVLVISQETPFKNVTDILAIDAQGNVLVIEVKRGQTPRDVIAQALEYASDVADWSYDRLNRTAAEYYRRRGQSFTSLVEEFTAAFNPEEASEELFNQHQRIFVVGESIDDKVSRTARWLLKRGIPMTCLSYQCYVSEDGTRQLFLDINEVVRPTELLGGGRGVNPPIGPLGEHEAVERLPDVLKGIYETLRETVKKFGDEVETYATKACFIFRSTKNFAEIPQVRRGTKLLVRVRPEGYSITENKLPRSMALT